jgi:energy-coupling factor transporter transmembrane protein EcfT
MKLVNIFKTIILVLFISFVAPLSSSAADVVAYSTIVRDTTNDAQVYSRLVTRLSEIQSMDKSNLSSVEKKNLRNELKDMKKAADGLNRGVYISVGAIIIIILLLILILR